MKKIALLLALLLTVMTCFVGCNPTPEKDLERVQDAGKLIVGITDFAPMDYKDENGNWIGFDADMANKFAEYLGVDAEFVEINWDNKAMELKTGAIDVVWNGMTITDEVKGLMGVGTAYCKNMQVVVMKADKVDQYATIDSLKALTFAVENGSAGAAALDALTIEYTAVDTQAKALMEVESGSVDACVIDLLMAGAMTGEGTSYADLASGIAVTDEEEEYGVGFRKDSALIAEFNAFWAQCLEDGTALEVATEYNIAKNIITD